MLLPKEINLKDLEIEGKQKKLEYLTNIRGLEIESETKRMKVMEKINELELKLKQDDVELQRIKIETKNIKLAALKRKLNPNN